MPQGVTSADFIMKAKEPLRNLLTQDQYDKIVSIGNIKELVVTVGKMTSDKALLLEWHAKVYASFHECVQVNNTYDRETIPEESNQPTRI